MENRLVISFKTCFFYLGLEQRILKHLLKIMRDISEKNLEQVKETLTFSGEGKWKI